MSMNLHCNQLDLWQTPTWITYMCTMLPNGYVGNNLEGDDAKRALHMYTEWVGSQTMSVTENEEEAARADERRAIINEHIAKVRDAAESADLKVWWM